MISESNPSQKGINKHVAGAMNWKIHDRAAILTCDVEVLAGETALLYFSVIEEGNT